MRTWSKAESSLPSGFESLNGKVRYVQCVIPGNEFSSSCPNCNGEIHRDGTWPDRFRMFIKGKTRGWCRKCGYIWFPDMTDPNYVPDVEQIRRWNDEREQEYRRQKETAERALALLETERRWIDYHKNMQEEQRVLWRDAGIPDGWQDYWQLGYTPERSFEFGGEFYTRPAMTIPKFDFNWKPTNIDFRLLNPPPNMGKYRPLPNIPASVFLSTPDELTFRDEVYVAEGSKKAAVMSLYVEEELSQVIGVPSKNSWAGIEQRLKDCGRIWVVFDPDATDWAHKFAIATQNKNARIIELPVKPDDAILQYGMRRRDWICAKRGAVVASKGA